MFVQTLDTQVQMACADFSSIFDLVKIYSVHIIEKYINMSDTDDTCAAVVIACLTEKKKVKRKRKQRVWMKEWLKKRDQFCHDHLVAELKISSAVDYKNYLRMDADTFGELLEKIRPLIEKKCTYMRDPITAKQRLSPYLKPVTTSTGCDNIFASFTLIFVPFILASTRLISFF